MPKNTGRGGRWACHRKVINELYALRNDAVAGASGHFGIDANGNRTRTDTVTTVHRLGQALPKTTGHTD
ncbi:hypothetical protein ADL04_15775 [Streptomyces sp. NRRL B-3648]|nr:hypothetical protein ADL04_15775 [Streptomyces sp. NRRL B-3648]